MNNQDLRTSIQFTKIIVLMVVTCLALVLPLSISAEEPYQVEFDDFEENASGPFDGLDSKGNRIWVNDTVYYLARTVRVKGTSTKLGLLTDLKPGEEVKLTLKPNEKEPSIPYVVQIERE